MENLVNDFSGKRVLVTGHTGFKGAWLCEWLLGLGAKVTGFSRDLPTQPSLFQQLGLERRMEDLRGDIREPDRVARAVDAARPDFVFHLAAQPLVRAAYEQPFETVETNTLGALRLLEALRGLNQDCAVVMVATDKCYENDERGIPCREGDALGGRDPYSASKACAEILTAAWRASFFKDHPVRIASARAGNVIGGGDWAKDRLIPDAARALAAGRPVAVRNPASIRPWQHVLEPLGGYLALAAKLATGAPGLDEAFNFGPAADSHQPVRTVVEILLKHWPGTWEAIEEKAAPHEARTLRLDIQKADAWLDWRPRWDLETALRATAEWYQLAAAHPGEIPAFTRRQITAYAS